MRATSHFLTPHTSVEHTTYTVSYATAFPGKHISCTYYSLVTVLNDGFAQESEGRRSRLTKSREKWGGGNGKPTPSDQGGILRDVDETPPPGFHYVEPPCFVIEYFNECFWLVGFLCLLFWSDFHSYKHRCHACHTGFILLHRKINRGRHSFYL